jgi:dTDP-4-amino-4,6-dideoxygalactose transaminase
MFVPTYQGLTPLELVWPARSALNEFPFDAPRHWYFYRARNAIYHLFRILRTHMPAVRVLAPDYNSGNEVLAMRAAGATVRYCPIGRDLRLDPAEVERQCARHQPDVLYVIHYAGWPQPMAALADLCRRRKMTLVEDCALALLSADGSQPLGTFGHWSVFCLYKTLPLPNGAVLVQNTEDRVIEQTLDEMPLRSPGARSAVGRTAELMVQRLRSRADRLGSALDRMKRGAGRAATALNVRGPNVGDIGFEIDDVDLAMSSVSIHVLRRLDLAAIRARRIANYRELADRLRGSITAVFATLPDGVCPLFFPVLVPNKREAALALQARGVDALEFWNDRVELHGCEPGAAEPFLHAHVLELPVHQDLTARHLDHMVRQVASLDLRMPNVADSVSAA